MLNRLLFFNTFAQWFIINLSSPNLNCGLQRLKEKTRESLRKVFDMFTWLLTIKSLQCSTVYYYYFFFFEGGKTILKTVNVRRTETTGNTIVIKCENKGKKVFCWWFYCQSVFFLFARSLDVAFDRPTVSAAFAAGPRPLVTLVFRFLAADPPPVFQVHPVDPYYLGQPRHADVKRDAFCFRPDRMKNHSNATSFELWR